MLFYHVRGYGCASKIKMVIQLAIMHLTQTMQFQARNGVKSVKNVKTKLEMSTNQQ